LDHGVVTHHLEDRLRILAQGVRPTFAALCGLPPQGTVDILEPTGIFGWQVGIQMLVDAPTPLRDSSVTLLRWARAELQADPERWRHLAAFSCTFSRAITCKALDALTTEQEAARFWQSWHRNMLYAHDLLMDGKLLVSPRSVAALSAVSSALPSLPTTILLRRTLDRVRTMAVDPQKPGAGEPPPLVLPQFRDQLVAALST